MPGRQLSAGLYSSCTRIFCECRILPALTALHLRDNFITWDGAEELNDVLLIDLFPALAVLTIGLNRISAINMSLLYVTQDTLRRRGHAMYIDNDAYDHDHIRSPL